MNITIMHNMTKDEHGRNMGYVDGYLIGHTLERVFSYDRPTATSTAPLSSESQRLLDQEILREVFHAFNVGDDPSFGEPMPIAVAYRRKRLRSLSVGDVVMMEGRAWCCQHSGWGRLADDRPASPEQVADYTRECELAIEQATNRYR